MKNIILFLFIPFLSCGQFFNNSNNELCYELYKTSDALSEYRVFIVIDNIDENDQKMLDTWSSLSYEQRIIIVNRWATDGKRIEAERGPDYINYTPIFPKKLNTPNLLPNLSNKPDDWGPWDSYKSKTTLLQQENVFKR